jgi:hypothetical protein
LVVDRSIVFIKDMEEGNPGKGLESMSDSYDNNTHMSIPWFRSLNKESYCVFRVSEYNELLDMVFLG